MIAIIKTGNAGSVKKALDYLGDESIVTHNPEEIEKADRIVFPGVGSFGFMMNRLREKGLDEAIGRAIGEATPFLGICLGLQVLFEESEESPGVKGLGIFRGTVMRYRRGKIPQIGWNKVIPVRKGIFREGYAYFVNSYYVVPEDKRIVAANADYSGAFCSAVQYRNITAVQFHPEKSGSYGMELLGRWLKC